MIYDISTPVSAFQFIQKCLNITCSDFMNEYVIECNNDFDIFWNKRKDNLALLDIENLKYKGLHVTSNWNECVEIKKNGLRDLKLVLSEDTNLKKFLQDYGVKFDIKGKTLFIDNRRIDIDYEKNKKIKTYFTDQEKSIKAVGRKIYSDSQVNAFFSMDAIFSYGSDIYCRPEFLMNLSKCDSKIRDIENVWRDKSQGYIVVFVADFNQLSSLTFYKNDYEYERDNNRIHLKKCIIERAIKRYFNFKIEECMYIKKDVTIEPNKIIEYKLYDSK